MSEDPFEAIEKLEKLAAWHRINAEYAGADWVWEARLRTAENLENKAAQIRARLLDREMTGRSQVSGELANHADASPRKISLVAAHRPRQATPAAA